MEHEEGKKVGQKKASKARMDMIFETIHEIGRELVEV
jgi:hypothetical protein